MRIEFHAPLKHPDHPVPSGDRRMARLFAEAMRRGGHDVRTGTRLRSYDGAGDGRRQSRIRRLGGRLAERILRRYRGDPPDLWFTYHLYHKAPDWLGPAVSAALGIPYVIAEASFAPKQAGGPWGHGHDAVAAALARASRAICVNPDDAACVRPLLAGPERLVEMAPFLDTAPPRAAAKLRQRHRVELAARHGLDMNTPWIAVAAMMRPGDKLASYRALGAALDRLGGRAWLLLVAGDGEARAEVAACLGFAGRVRLLGQIDAQAVDSLNAAADLTVWPAINEAYGMALLEAQAAGLPAVAGDRPGVRQIIRHDLTGLIAPSGDPDGFAGAIAMLLDDPDRRRAMAGAALDVTRRDHDIAGAASRLDEILLQAVEPVA
jgi:glycosyltransferase involved in cell wall biosynthesis